MRIGVVSDTHLQPGQHVPPNLVAALNGVDIIAHAGDIISLEVIDALEKVAPVKAVLGNMDFSLRPRFPERLTFEAEGMNIGLIHGWGPPKGIRQRVLNCFDPRPDLIIYGHTHQPFSGEEFDVFFFNPGAAIDTVYTEFNSVGVLEIEGGILVKTEIIKL